MRHKNIFTIITLVGLLIIPLSKSHAVPSFSHEIWNQLLEKNVTQHGKVYYDGFKKNQETLDSYLKLLSTNPPQPTWTKKESMAFWINAYNAFTIKLILENLPLNSIQEIKKDGKNAWDIGFIKIGQKTYTLNQIEHEILRKNYDDPRIHFALNCTAISCPRLFNKAYMAEQLEQQFDLMAKVYINDVKQNKLSGNSIKISKIFDWYAEDFTKNGSVIDYLNKYSKTKINSNASISYLEYDWGLNK